MAKRTSKADSSPTGGGRTIIHAALPPGERYLPGPIETRIGGVDTTI